jgi:hypothetical protein
LELSCPATSGRLKEEPLEITTTSLLIKTRAFLRSMIIWSAKELSFCMRSPLQLFWSTPQRMTVEQISAGMEVTVTIGVQQETPGTTTGGIIDCDGAVGTTGGATEEEEWCMEVVFLLQQKV